MNLPSVILNLLIANDNFESHSYAHCFTETALVLDEGKTYEGKIEIQNWIEKVNQDYKTVMKPLEYSAEKKILKCEVSGTFPGSPIILNYEFTIVGGLIESLFIKG